MTMRPESLCDHHLVNNNFKQTWNNGIQDTNHYPIYATLKI